MNNNTMLLIRRIKKQIQVLTRRIKNLFVNTRAVYVVYISHGIWTFRLMIDDRTIIIGSEYRSLTEAMDTIEDLRQYSRGAKTVPLIREVEAPNE